MDDNIIRFAQVKIYRTYKVRRDGRTIAIGKHGGLLLLDDIYYRIRLPAVNLGSIHLMQLWRTGNYNKEGEGQKVKGERVFFHEANAYNESKQLPS